MNVVCGTLRFTFSRNTRGWRIYILLVVKGLKVNVTCKSTKSNTSKNRKEKYKSTLEWNTVVLVQETYFYKLVIFTQVMNLRGKIVSLLSVIYMFCPISAFSIRHLNHVSKGPCLRSLSTTLPASNVDESTSSASKRRNKKDKSGREKRRQFIGKAKAVDRGQWANIYIPGGDNGTSFTALSGLPDRSTPYIVLGIESSCDDTGAAVVRSDGVILGESLASQNEIHEEWGGIVPGLAKNAHAEKIDTVIQEAISRAGLQSVADVDAIGVTVGPGLEICLRVGCNKARSLAMEHKKPFVGVHHLEAHILMARLPFDDTAKFTTGGSDGIHQSSRSIQFPFLALLVSGGHCQLLKCNGIGKYSIIGGTIDDSLGKNIHIYMHKVFFHIFL
jgi:hypothetical protein